MQRAARSLADIGATFCPTSGLVTAVVVAGGQTIPRLGKQRRLLPAAALALGRSRSARDGGGGGGLHQQLRAMASGGGRRRRIVVTTTTAPQKACSAPATPTAAAASSPQPEVAIDATPVGSGAGGLAGGLAGRLTVQGAARTPPAASTARIAAASAGSEAPVAPVLGLVRKIRIQDAEKNKGAEGQGAGRLTGRVARVVRREVASAKAVDGAVLGLLRKTQIHLEEGEKETDDQVTAASANAGTGAVLGLLRKTEIHLEEGEKDDQVTAASADAGMGAVLGLLRNTPTNLADDVKLVSSGGGGGGGVSYDWQGVVGNTGPLNGPGALTGLNPPLKNQIAREKKEAVKIAIQAEYTASKIASQIAGLEAWPDLEPGVGNKATAVVIGDHVAEFRSWDPDTVHFLALGGCGKIGMNLYVFGYKGRLLVVDAGMMIPNQRMRADIDKILRKKPCEPPNFCGAAASATTRTLCSSAPLCSYLRVPAYLRTCVLNH